jgi:hypothetical protein
MSSNLSALLSATFYEAGYRHVVELVHQRDEASRRRLASLDLAAWDAGGKLRAEASVDPRDETLDLDALLAGHAGGERLMVTFDARYDERIFPYRPHHYAWLHRRGSGSAPLYYAVNAVLGGVPDRIGATALNNFETYVFLRRPLAERYAVLVGNVSRFSTAEAQVFTYYVGGARVTQRVELDPKAHVEVVLPEQHEGARLERVEVKALFRLATYVLGRHAAGGELLLYDHMFTYFK